MAGNDKEFTEDIVITNFIPTIAKIWESTTNVSELEFANRFNHLLDTYEVLLKSLAAILYGRVHHYYEAPQIDESLKRKFVRPALGVFHEFIKACLKALGNTGDVWGSDLGQGLRKKLSCPAVINICRFVKTELFDQEWKNTKVTVNELFGILVGLRNRTRGHGAVREELCEKINDDFHETLIELFKVLRPVLEGEWYTVQSVRNISASEHKYEMFRFRGTHKKRVTEILTDTHLINRRLYALDEQLTPSWIDLWPLVLWENKEIHLYNSVSSGKVTFLCYTSKSENPILFKGFEELFNLPPAPEAFKLAEGKGSSAEPSEGGRTTTEISEGEGLSESDTGDRAAAAVILKGTSASNDQDEPLIFVSYAHADDQPLPHETEGWVTILVNRLKKQLDVKLDYEAKIEVVQVTSNIIDSIPNTPFLIVILSPNYVASDWCQGEFLHAIKTRVRHSSVFVIERNQLEDTNLPPEFDEVTDYRYNFYVVDRKEGGPHVLMPNLQQDLPRYNNLLARLNSDLTDKLQKLQRQRKYVPRTDTKISPDARVRPTVFLAGVTDDLEVEREEIKSSLTEANIQVIPEICYFNEPESFEEAIHNNLIESDLFIQLLGPHPGKKPPGLPQGYVCRQYELAQEAGKQIMQWRSPKLDLKSIHNSDWRDFLEHKTVRAIELDEFTSAIVKKLAPAQPSEKGKKPGKRPPMIFIDVYNDDLALARNLCQILDKLGAGYFLPLQSDKPSENREAFEQYVLHCDATMIVYGDVTPKWVSDQVLAMQKIFWQREHGSAPAILDGPPRQKPLGQKSPITFKLPGMEILQCRNQLDEQQLANFIKSIQATL